MALSLCEAEYIAATTVTCQEVRLERLLSNLRKKGPSKVTLLVDNKSAISLSKNLVMSITRDQSIST